MMNCSVCGHPFRSEAMLRAHMKLMHPTPEARAVESATEQVTHTKTFLWNEEGQRVLQECKKLAPLPVCFQSRAGMSKSALARQLAQDLGYERAAIVHGHSGMVVDYETGMWLPQTREGHIVVEPVWGRLSRAARDGDIFLFEEFNRAPQEFVSRFFGLLDNGFRSWEIPEIQVDNVPIHQRFWLLATMNPTGAGYYTNRIDEALFSRFVVYAIDSPLADEERIVHEIYGLPAKTAETLLKWAMDARRNEKSQISTRDICLVALLIQKGFEPVRAIELAAAPKYKSLEKGLDELAKAFAW